jgi:outer membrane immunogenic protein
MGGDGWYGTAGAGYDWQFNNSWVAGVFADGQFGSIRGSINDNLTGLTGAEKLRDTWAVGARVGYLVTPNVYSYVNGGFTESYWSGATISPATGAAEFTTTPSFTRDGWFIGGGVENSVGIFGIHIPGLFMKTEYRAAHFDRATLPETSVLTGLPTGRSVTFKPLVQIISTSLVYRFNWGGTVVPKY